MQTLALVPALRAAKFRWRPRFDWRGSGLTRPLRAAGWLVMLVLTNQAAYWVVTRLSTATGQHAVDQGVAGGAGYTAYSYAFQLWVVPQGIVTVADRGQHRAGRRPGAPAAGLSPATGLRPRGRGGRGQARARTYGATPGG